MLRKERSKLNKRAHALARKELIKVETQPPSNIVNMQKYIEAHMPNGRGMLTYHEQNRRRGALDDATCIDLVCEFVAQGMNAKAARKHIGIPETTWYYWRRDNHHDLESKYRIAREMFLEGLADDCIEIFEQLLIQRQQANRRLKSEMVQWQEDMRAWELAKAQDKNSKVSPPQMPEYDGPNDYDLKLAEARANIRRWKLERLHPAFRAKSEISNNTAINLTQELKTDLTDEQALELYAKIVNGQTIYE